MKVTSLVFVLGAGIPVLCAAKQQIATQSISYNAPLSVTRWTAYGETAMESAVHEALRALPFFTVFDHLEYRIGGSTILLSGAVVNPALAQDAGIVLSNIPGVVAVENEIHILPDSTADRRTRLVVFAAIYGDSYLARNGYGEAQPIHIIVEGGIVALEGEVLSDADKGRAENLARAAARGSKVVNRLAVRNW